MTIRLKCACPCRFSRIFRCNTRMLRTSWGLVTRGLPLLGFCDAWPVGRNRCINLVIVMRAQPNLLATWTCDAPSWSTQTALSPLDGCQTWHILCSFCCWDINVSYTVFMHVQNMREREMSLSRNLRFFPEVIKFSRDFWSTIMCLGCEIRIGLFSY